MLSVGEIVNRICAWMAETKCCTAGTLSVLRQVSHHHVHNETLYGTLPVIYCQRGFLPTVNRHLLEAIPATLQ